MITEKIAYQDGSTQLEGYLAYDNEKSGKKPAIIICHDWSGCNEFAQEKAQQLAKLGYVGFALDIYGKKIGTTNEEKTQLMQPFIADRALLRRRLLAAYNTVTNLTMVDKRYIAGIGFCFGGLCVLDLARSGVSLRGVVSFHGFFDAPKNLSHETIQAKILAFHGYNDPMVSKQQMDEFANEMTAAKVDWQIHIFGNTMHAFMNPEANDPQLGTVYNPVAAQRAWQITKDFFNEIFARNA